MKKAGLFLLLLVFLVACSDEAKHRISGQWQLKTINRDGIVSQVDTVFYSFHLGTVFSVTLLQSPDIAMISYGYMEMLSEQDMMLSMDTTRADEGYFICFAPEIVESFGWDVSNRYQQVYSIERIDGNELVLSNNGVVYSFNKY